MFEKMFRKANTLSLAAALLIAGGIAAIAQDGKKPLSPPACSEQSAEGAVPDRYHSSATSARGQPPVARPPVRMSTSCVSMPGGADQAGGSVWPRSQAAMTRAKTGAASLPPVAPAPSGRG